MITEYVINNNKYTYCMNCDWLQFSVRLENPENVELECPEGFRIEIMQGNNNFRNRAIVWRLSDSSKWLTLLWSPYSRVIKPWIMTVQLGNMLLYKDGIQSAFRILQNIVPCSFNSCGRLDICCDFQANTFEMDVIRCLWQGSMYVTKKQAGSEFWHSNNSNDGRFVHCLSWGSKNSEIKVKLYDKTRELGVTPNNSHYEKPWIVNQWQSAGFDIQRVWRLEFSMQSSGQLRWNGETIKLNDIASSGWIMSIFIQLYHKRFIIRRNEGGRNGHHNEDPQVILLVLPKTSDSLKWSGSQTDETTVSSEQIKLLRKLMSIIELPAVKCDDDMFNNLAKSILDLCEHRGITSYFCHCYGDTPMNILQNMFNEGGSGIKHMIAKPNYII